MERRGSLVITSLVLVALTITTGMVLADDGPNGQHDDGTNSTLAGNFSTVSGGLDNAATADVATVGGGQNNTASGVQSTVSGGIANTASGLAATVGGGHQNTASGERATIAGGRLNTATGFKSTVAGGRLNTASGHESAVGGGHQNTASGERAAIGGGFENQAGGATSTVPGGFQNSASGDFSLAAGRRAQANHNGAFVWADATDEDFASTSDNQFLIRASGGVGIGTNSPNQLLVVGDPFASPLPGNRVTIGNTGVSGPNGRSGLNLGEDQDQRAFILWHNDENCLQLGVRNGNLQENDALVIKDDRVGVGTATPAQRLHVNGNVQANQFLTPSSLKWKTNVQTLAGALEKVQDLRGVSYDWKADGKHDIGLIAEEVSQVLPEVVAYGENGRDAAAVDYARLVPVLIEAVKEQQKAIRALEEQNRQKDAQIAAARPGRLPSLGNAHRGVGGVHGRASRQCPDRAPSIQRLYAVDAGWWAGAPFGYSWTGAGLSPVQKRRITSNFLIVDQLGQHSLYW
jgi:hypothetical protein